MNDIEKLLGHRPHESVTLDAQFTADALARISRAEQAEPAKKGFSGMKLPILRPLQGLSAGAVLATAGAIAVSAATITYMWYQTSVTPLESSGKMSSFQTQGCPDFYKLQNNPEALKQASLSHVKKFELRPDVAILPVEEQQKIAQAYCEMNQLRAYVASNWPADARSFTDVTEAIKVTSLSQNELRGERLYYDADKPGQDTTQPATIAIDPATQWLVGGTLGTAADFKVGDVVAPVMEHGTGAKTLAVAKLDLTQQYYSPRTQSMLVPINPCAGTAGEECLDVQMRSTVLFTANEAGSQQGSKEVQANIVSITGDVFTFKSRGGKTFSLTLPNATVENGTVNNLHLEPGDYLHIYYNGELGQGNASRADLLLYGPNGKFGPYLKYKAQ